MPLRGKPSANVAAVAGSPDHLWLRCAGCGAAVYYAALEQNWQVCGDCGRHYPLAAPRRIQLLVDPGSFVETDTDLVSTDALGLGPALYTDRLAAARQATGLKEAILCGTAAIERQPLAMGVMDGRFLDASLGATVGEKITRLTELATQKGLPLLLVAASRGARIQEGAFSLMQMAKTVAALEQHRGAGLPYLALLTHPTSGTVMASFAALGDVILAEPGAQAGFAGPRTIRHASRELTPRFQTAESLVEHGLVDRIVPRNRQRRELALLLGYFSARAGKSTER